MENGLGMQRAELGLVVSWSIGGQKSWHFDIAEPNEELCYPGSEPLAGRVGLRGGKEAKERRTEGLSLPQMNA